MFSPTDTIVAIATPPGRGGVGVVRVSGPRTGDIAQQILTATEPLAPRVATFTRVMGTAPVQTDARAIDHVVATWFPGPYSYTGEDVLEVSAHGSPIVLETIVGAAMNCGARLAEPGEFTLRAFLNGRIDLVQAEAVADLVDAVTPLQARAAFDQLEGTLTQAIATIDAALFDLIARLEASIDFPDEGYHFIAPGSAEQDLARIAADLAALVGEGVRGRVIREGRQVVITGKPNVGKSTLFNRLLGTDRAIVTPVAGTTRDLVTEVTNLDGVRVCLVDTAGMRESTDVVESEGVRRARSAAGIADLVVVVLDRSRPLDEDDRRLLSATRGTDRLIVSNKCDLPADWGDEALAGMEDGAAGEDTVAMSLVTNAGVNDMKHLLRARLLGAEGLRDVPAVTNVRHIALLKGAGEAIARARTVVRDTKGEVPEEFVLADLQQARACLEEVTGRRTTDDLLRHIFGRFCVGK